MREEKRTRMVPQEYSVFISKDGVEFPNKHDCEVHEMILDGTAKVCPDCQGKKVREVEKVELYPIWNHEIHGYPEVRTKECVKCSTCKGKGYLKLRWE